MKSQATSNGANMWQLGHVINVVHDVRSSLMMEAGQLHTWRSIYGCDTVLAFLAFAHWTIHTKQVNIYVAPVYTWQMSHVYDVYKRLLDN
jgi:hypothetical protein